MRCGTCEPSWQEAKEKPEESRNVKFQICCALEKPLPQQLTFLTASRSLRPDMVLRHQGNNVSLQKCRELKRESLVGHATHHQKLHSACSTAQHPLRLLCDELNKNTSKHFTCIITARVRLDAPQGKVA